MRKRVLVGLMLAAALTLLGACLMVMDSDQPETTPNPGEFHQALDLKPGGSISLTNPLGNVGITGWDKESVDVFANVVQEEVREGHRVRAGSQWDVSPGVQIGQKGNTVRIKTRSQGWPWTSGGGLDFALNVPSSVDLKDIRVERGDVTVSDVYGNLGAVIGEGSLFVKNFSGSLTASVQTGQVDVEVLDMHAEDVVDIGCQAGDIILRLQPGSNVRIEAECGRGEVSSEIDVGQPLPAKSLIGHMGQGGAVIRLRAAGGNIRIVKTD